MDKLKIDACYESDDHSALYILSKWIVAFAIY